MERLVETVFSIRKITSTYLHLVNLVINTLPVGLFVMFVIPLPYDLNLLLILMFHVVLILIVDVFQINLFVLNLIQF